MIKELQLRSMEEFKQREKDLFKDYQFEEDEEYKKMQVELNTARID